MFNRLLKLYESNREKTPLEDFTTEIFVGVMENEKELLNAFSKEILELKSDNFEITSQQYCRLENDPNCKIDIVITGTDEICFIENKVNSKEGYEQLERYSKVLNGLSKDFHKTKLVYCTKNAEYKEIKEHDFKRIRWHQIAQFLRQFINAREPDKLTALFIGFLTDNGMGMDMKLSKKDIEAMNGFSRVYTLMKTLLLSVQDNFNTLFGTSTISIKSKNEFEAQLEDLNRLCVYKEGILKGDDSSAIAYSIQLDGFLKVEIYVPNESRNFSKFKSIVDNQKGNLMPFDFETGYLLITETELKKFQDNENADSEIEKWFNDSFMLMKEFMIKTKEELRWNFD